MIPLGSVIGDGADAATGKEAEMPKKKHDKIEIEVPRGRIVIRHACCPQGCDLMDPETPIHEHPSIHMAYEFEGRKGSVHVDPIYGSHDNIYDVEIPKGTIAEFLCPKCGATLTDPDANCSDCSAPMFILHLPEGGSVEACRRIGCFNHGLRIVTGEEMMQRLFDDLGMDSFL